MDREFLLDKVRKSEPEMGWDSEYPDLFGVYGMTCEGWTWFEEDKITDYARRKGYKPITKATDTELLQMWAMASDCWLNYYRKWYRESQEKSSKLDQFIGRCERDYFGYDEDGYTDKSTDRVFKLIFEILDDHFKR